MFKGSAKKRWMQIDIRKTNINICMDHKHRDFSLNDILTTGISNVRSKGKSGFDLKVDKDNFDALHFTFYEEDPFVFNRK
jgi:hypothetical protein